MVVVALCRLLLLRGVCGRGPYLLRSATVIVNAKTGCVCCRHVGVVCGWPVVKLVTPYPVKPLPYLADTLPPFSHAFLVAGTTAPGRPASPDSAFSTQLFPTRVEHLFCGLSATAV